MNNLSEDLRLKLDALPNESGVYIMKRRDGQIIYIGKAKSLRDRVRSYFRTSGGDGRRQFKALVRNIADIDYIVTGNEQEALILEATQIRTHKPRYNILLKDDKKYPYIRITAEPFPRIFATRDVVRDGSRYLGPYSNVRAMHTTLDMLRKVFPIRSCNAELPSDKVPLCLEYHIKRCEGPCENLVSADDYRKTVERAVRFLRGQNAEVIRELQKRMTEAAEDMRYEKAARFRDQIQALESMRARQKVVLDESNRPRRFRHGPQRRRSLLQRPRNPRGPPARQKAPLPRRGHGILRRGNPLGLCAAILPAKRLRPTRDPPAGPASRRRRGSRLAVAKSRR